MAKTGMAGLNPAEKVAHARKVVTAMTGNLSFATPTPTLLVVGDAATDLEDKNNAAKNGDHEKIVLRNEAADVLDDLMVRLSLYVSNTAQGSESIILSSGFEVRKPGEPVGLPAKPENFRADMGPLPGSVEMRWTPVHGAYLYHVEVNASDPPTADGWARLDECSTASFVAQDREPGRYHWFRVRAIGAYPDPGPFSDPAKGYATPLP